MGGIIGVLIANELIGINPEHIKLLGLCIATIITGIILFIIWRD